MDFNNWIRKLFFFFSMNPVYKFVDRSNFLFLQPPKLFHEYHQLDKKKKTKLLLFSRNSGLIMSEKFCIPVSIANFVCRASTKGSNNLEFKQSFERIGWRTRKEKTKGAGSMTHARLLKESPTTSSRSRHSLAPPCSLETDLFRIPHPGTAFTFGFLHAPFSAPARISQPTNPSLLSLHEPPRAEYINKEERDASTDRL